jgi:hypothetical protein
VAAVRPTRPTAPAAAPASGTASSDAPVAPARPQRPAAPTLQQRAAVPTPDVQEPYDPGLSTGLVVPTESEIFDDEDAVIVPAPEPSAFIPKPKPTTTADFRARAAEKKRLEFKRTTIPILLTLGVIMFAFAALRYCLGPDSPLTTLPIWVPILLIIVGCGLLAFAAMNMLSVQADMAKMGKNG